MLKIALILVTAPLFFAPIALGQSRANINGRVTVEDGKRGPLSIVLEAKPTDQCDWATPPSYEKANRDNMSVIGTVKVFGGSFLGRVKVVLLGSAQEQTTTSNQAGEFRFTGVEPGKYSLSVSDPRYGQVWASRFWVVRDVLTRATLVVLPKGNLIDCMSGRILQLKGRTK